MEHNKSDMAQDSPASAYREVSTEDILSKYLSSNGESITKPLFRQVSPDQLESAHIYTKRQLLDYTAKKTSTALFISNKDAEPEPKAAPIDPLVFRQERENEFEKQLDSYQKLKPVERVEHLKDVGGELRGVLESGFDPIEKMKRIIKAGEDTFLISKSALVNLDALAKTERPETLELLRQNQKIKETARESRDIIASVTKNLSEKMETRRFLSKLETYKDGSTLSHINRVFIQTTKFLLFLNHNVKHGLAEKIGQLFEPGQKYERHYKLPFSKVVKDGFRHLTDDEITTSSFSALLHDIGKIPHIDYFESGAAYDRSTIELHAIKGYEMLAHTKDYPAETAFVAGSHHEYGGHPSGYGVRRSVKRYQNPNPRSSTPFVLTYDLDDITSFAARDHFLAEVVALVDVFDAMSCVRPYREKTHTEKEALNLMKDMTVQDHKLNLLLYDLFVTFVASDLSKDSLRQEFDPSSLIR